MKFAIAFANTGPFVDPGPAIEFARSAEAAGFESLWTVEHVVVPANYQSTYPYSPTGRMPGREDASVPDPLVWLAFLAAATTTIRLATGILILPQRQPVVLAKELATLDYLSGGRLELGVGVGWLREEFDAIGVPFEQRGRRTEEYVAAMRVLWNDSEATFSGEYTNFNRCISRPQPVNGTIPVHVGGHSEIAARRAGRLGDGFFPGEGRHELLTPLIEVARSSADAFGRDGDALEITSGGLGAVGERALDEVAALAAMGVDRIIVPAFHFYRGTNEALARYGAEVIGPAASIH